MADVSAVLAVLVLEAVGVPNHVLADRALELLPTVATQLQNVSHGVLELVLLLLLEEGFQLFGSVTLQGPAAGVLESAAAEGLRTGNVGATVAAERELNAMLGIVKQHHRPGG